MRQRRIVYKLAFAAAAVWLASGCADEIYDGRPAAHGDGPRFSVSAESWEGGVFAAATRGEVNLADGIPVDLMKMTNERGDTSDVMIEAMMGCPAPGVKTLDVLRGDAGTRGNPIKNITDMEGANHTFKISCITNGSLGIDVKRFTSWDAIFDREDGGTYYWKLSNTTSENRFWPNFENVAKFYAWYPADLAVNTANYSFEHIVPTDVADQKDLLYYVTGSLNIATDAVIDIPFKHCLTMVRFKGGGELDMQIKKITLKNIQSSGSFNMETGIWELDSSTEDYTLDLYARHTGGLTEDTTDDHWETSSDGVNWTSATDDILNDGELTLFMLPQAMTNPNGSAKTIEITLEDDTKLTATLSGDAWEIGKTVTYTLLPNIMGGLTASAWSSNAIPESVATFDLYSWRYKSLDDGAGNPTYKYAKQACPWKVTTIDGSTDFSTVDTKGFKGFMAQGSAYGDNGNNWEFDNLSSATPNVKLVNASTGQYRVFVGCPEMTVSSIDDHELPYNELFAATAPVTDMDLSAAGDKSANCYVVEGAGSYRFLACKGNDKTQTLTGTPYIISDSRGMIQNLSTATDGGNTYVTFETVGKDNLRQATVIIGLKDAGDNLLWAWHIWITRQEKWDKSVKTITTNGVTAKFGVFIFGRVRTGYIKSWQTVPIKLVVKQTDSSGNDISDGKSIEITLQKSRGADVIESDRTPVFAWGYAVPLKVYNYATKNSDNIARFEEPRTINHWNASPDAGHTDDVNYGFKKGLYDPFPYGYCVPSMAALSLFDFEKSTLVNTSGTLQLRNSSGTAIITSWGNSVWTAGAADTGVTNAYILYFRETLGFEELGVNNTTNLYPMIDPDAN